MFNKRIYTKIVFSIFILLVSGSFCVNQLEAEEITVTDLAGRDVSLNVPVKNVVLASSRYIHEFSAVAGKNFASKIVGWSSDLANYDQDSYTKYKEAFPEIETIPDVGAMGKGTFSVEKVIALEADAVLVPLWEFELGKSQEFTERLEQVGIPVIFLDFWKDPFTHPPQSIQLLGKILGEEQRAQEIANFYQEQVDIVYSRLKTLNKPKPTVYIESGWKGPSEYGSAYGNNGWGAVVTRAGGKNIAEDVIEKTAQINPEYLFKTNPQIIIITGSFWTTTSDSMRLGYYATPDESQKLLQGFLTRPGWNELDAVKHHAVFSIFHGFSFRIYNFAAIQQFAKWFYPDVFQDIDPEKNLQEFHQRFSAVDYSGVWMLRLEQ